MLQDVQDGLEMVPQSRNNSSMSFFTYAPPPGRNWRGRRRGARRGRGRPSGRGPRERGGRRGGRRGRRPSTRGRWRSREGRCSMLDRIRSDLVHSAWHSQAKRVLRGRGIRHGFGDAARVALGVFGQRPGVVLFIRVGSCLCGNHLWRRYRYSNEDFCDTGQDFCHTICLVFCLLARTWTGIGHQR
jgi:hypothetical protein